MKKLFGFLFVSAMLAMPMFAQDALNSAYWNSLSPEGRMAFVRGFVLEVKLDKRNTYLGYNLKTGTVPNAGNEDTFISVLNDTISSNMSENVNLPIAFGEMFEYIAVRFERNRSGYDVGKASQKISSVQPSLC